MRVNEEHEEHMEQEQQEAELLCSSPRRFWEIIKMECASLLVLNAVFVVVCIPLVTIPPAVFALNQVVRGVLDDRPGRVPDFFAAFAKNWKRAWGAFLLVGVPLAVSGYGLLFYLRFAVQNWLFFVPFMLCSTIFLTTLTASVCLYRLLANGERLSRKTVRLSLLLGLGRPLRAALAAAWYYVPLVIAVLWFPLSAAYLFLVGFSIPCLLGNLVLRKVLLLDGQKV